jgi:hypothetical protein
VVAAGCSAPVFFTHPDRAARLGSIRTVGLVAPRVTVYAETVGAPAVAIPLGLSTQRLEPLDEATRAANDRIRDAMIAAAAARGRAVVAIEPGTPEEREELEDLVDLYAAVDFSIARHAFGDLQEEFPSKQRRFEYSLGAMEGLLDRQGVEAAWLVTGFVLVPTGGARVRDVVETILAILSAAGGGPGATTVLPKFEMRAVLVDRDGTVLFAWRLSGDEGDDAEEEGMRTGRIADRCARVLFDELGMPEGR